eukprot:13157-Heterococcus_DN1.PRE.2
MTLCICERSAQSTCEVDMHSVEWYVTSHTYLQVYLDGLARSRSACGRRFDQTTHHDWMQGSADKVTATKLVLVQDHGRGRECTCKG